MLDGASVYFYWHEAAESVGARKSSERSNPYRHLCWSCILHGELPSQLATSFVYSSPAAVLNVRVWFIDITLYTIFKFVSYHRKNFVALRSVISVLKCKYRECSYRLHTFKIICRLHLERRRKPVITRSF